MKPIRNRRIQQALLRHRQNRAFLQAAFRRAAMLRPLRDNPTAQRLAKTAMHNALGPGRQTIKKLIEKKRATARTPLRRKTA